eukprot:g27294.t1
MFFVICQIWATHFPARHLRNAGYSVRCILRNRADRPFSFLVDWGATVVEGSLKRPESLPSALVGIHTVIDCATARPEEGGAEDIYDIDWEGKKRLIQCCKQMKIQRYVFCSIKDCDKYQSVPLMQIKYLTEKFLQESKIRYTILRVSGLMQPLISQYAVSVLDDQKVWGDDGSMPGIAYIDSQDRLSLDQGESAGIARFPHADDRGNLSSSRRVFKKLTKGKYEPEAGELEKEKAEAEAKLKQALSQDRL